MARTVGIGIQSFEKIISNQYFYIDKTNFISEWWESGDDVTLITRPRRFGKTLNMNTLERFLSMEYAEQGEVFQGLSIWKKEKYRRLQGTCPVIFISFASIKASTFSTAREMICMLVGELYRRHDFLLEGSHLKPEEKESFLKVFQEMTDSVFSFSLQNLSGYLSRYYGKKVIILLDEYDTPLQEAWIHGYWREMAEFIRGLFNATFKSNPYLDRAIMTGITRVGKESIFSDLNHLTVVTATSKLYADSFGFTEREVFAALEEYNLSEKRQEVKNWYDGFAFGNVKDIYNPWSILNYLKTGRLSTYWANTSSNGLIDRLIREGVPEIKIAMENLLNGERLYREIDEQIVFDQLTAEENNSTENEHPKDENAVWSLFLASGYLKVEGVSSNEETGEDLYEISLTNKEVQIMFRKMIRKWFSGSRMAYNGFIRAMLENDIKSMNAYMNKVALATFSYFDSGKKVSEKAEPEKFYHGFVLGLLVELSDRYVITSNRESGLGRYDVMLEPDNESDAAIIMEFKVREPEEETSLESTAKAALAQIEKMRYDTALVSRGILQGRIKKYGFAFEGKTVLIQGG